MKHKITTSAEGAVDIHVSASDSERTKLLQGFQLCQTGQCDCPSDEYAKVESMNVNSDDSGIRIRLQAKPDNEIDERKVEECLAWAEEQANSKKNRD